MGTSYQQCGGGGIIKELICTKISKHDISATGYPIHFMFGSRVGYLGTANLMASLKFTPR